MDVVANLFYEILNGWGHRLTDGTDYAPTVKTGDIWVARMYDREVAVFCWPGHLIRICG